MNGDVMRRVLMCPPLHYGIEYEINPWMSRIRGADPKRARRQWEKLHALLRGPMEFEIDLLDPVKGLPDLVFTANAGLVRGNAFLPARFRHPERQGEAPHFLRWFESHGFEIHNLPNGLSFEGEGDALRAGRDWFAGYRIRTDIQAHAAIGEFLGDRVLSVELADPRFYHLDTCFCPLGDDAAIWFPDAFDGYARRVIEAHVARLIPVDPEEACRFACNAVVSGKRVALNTGCRRLERTLEGAGFDVLATDLSEFLKAGGAAKCLVLFL